MAERAKSELIENDHVEPFYFHFSLWHKRQHIDSGIRNIFIFTCFDAI